MTNNKMKVLILFCMMASLNVHALPENEEEDTQPRALQIAVFCSADDKIPSRFKRLAYRFGKNIAEKKWGLITGGSKTGLMKEVIDGYVKTASPTAQPHSVKGILPSIFKEAAIHHPQINDQNLIWTDSVHGRLASFHKNSDVIVVLPGGFGTLHELMDFLVHNQFGLMNKKIILFNANHYWDGLLQQFRTMRRQSALHKKHLAHLQVVTNLNECMRAINTSQNKKILQGLSTRYWEKENKQR